jgi:hypothetical protein
MGPLFLIFWIILVPVYLFEAAASDGPVQQIQRRSSLQLAPPQALDEPSSSAPPVSVAGTGKVSRKRTGGPRSFSIRRVSGPPIIEAEEVSSAWLAQATRLKGFTQSSPREGARATEKTVVYLGYDTENLYVVFYCYDSDPSQIRANYSPRDDIQADDYVGIILDTFSDGRRAYKFLTNPLGVQSDSLFTEEAGEDLSFDAIYETHAKITSFGYLAIMTIPFRSLRFAKQSPQTWGINLVRTIRHKDEEIYWSPVYRNRRGFLNQAGKMTGLENIHQGRGFEFIPYFFASKTAVFDENRLPPSLVKQSKAKVGLDAKYGITSNLTANVTINPDFNDLEADQPKLRVNRRFKDSQETFVPEKRPFFLERSDVFETPLTVFFTRKIIDPKYGAKLTGKIGPYNVGFLSTRDAAPDIEFSEDTPLFLQRQRHATVNVLRVSRDLYNQSSVGFIALDRELGGGVDRLYGVDANFRFLDKYELTTQYVRSFKRALTENEEGCSSSNKCQGSGYLLTVARSARHLSMDAYYINLTPGFRSDLGFIERVDVNQFGGAVRYDFWPEGRVISWGPKLSYGRNYDHKGTLNDTRLELSLNFALAGNTAFGVKTAKVMERYAERNFMKHPLSFYVSTERAEKISGSLSYSFGPEVNYQEQDAFLGRGRELALDLTLRPNEHLKVSNIYLRSRLSNTDLPGLRRGFDAHILQTRINYQFNREFAVRFIPEFDFLRTHNQLSDNGPTRSSDRKRHLRGSFLFSYVLRPGTVLYAGYDSLFQDFDFVSRSHFRSAERGFFIKLSYLYR